MTQEKIIGDHTYRVTPLPASKAIAVGTRLFQVVGPSLGDLASGLEGKNLIKIKDLLDLPLDALGGAFKTLAFTLKTEDVNYLIDETMGAYCECVQDDRVLQLTKQFREIHFTGKVGNLMKVLFFALEVNFSGFLGDSLGSLKPVSKSPVIPAESP